MFFHAFAAENVIRRAAGRSAEVLTALASPQHADRKAFIIGAIDDDLLRNQVLEGLTDTQSLAACIAGTSGRAAREWVEARCRTLWERLRAEALGVSFRISDQGWINVDFEEATLTAWTALERALFAVMSQQIVEGHYLEEALGTIGVLDQRIAEEGVLLCDEARERKVVLRSGLFANAYIGRSGAVPGITHICAHVHRSFFRTTSDAVTQTIQRMLERDDLSPGQIYLLLMLSRGGDIAPPLILHALEAYWTGAPYHLRLELLYAAEGCRPANDSDRAALIAVMEALPQPEHPFISTTIVEALQSLGALDDSEREHNTVVREQVRQCLADPEDADRCAMAYGLHSAQFDHPYCGAYCEVIADLPENERKTLLTMAASGVGDTGFSLALLLVDLASFGDSGVGDSIARWTVLPPTNSVIPQESVAVFVVAHIALARLGCPLPDRRGEEDGHSAEALAACGALLYWCNRLELAETTKRHACSAPLRVLVRHERDAALDALRHCEHAFVECVKRLPGPAPLKRSIVDGFPSEAAEICRHALAEPFAQVGYFRHYSEDDRRQNLTFAINVLAQHGNSTDLQLLREYADDATLGTRAIAAVRTIEGRSVT